ncbi:MAG TPA: secondary thiamine-phosphate synthase enzyme YjbQ [Myxococcota bacterium]|nr:secondary thiamine-phosphate synthase enzyme YjbQ [Myxococcota bacterium]
MESFEISTRGHESLIDITGKLREAIKASGVEEGLALVYCPHTTGAITINENADPDVPRDILYALDKIAPWQAGYRHTEGNSAAHVKSSLVGSCVQVIVNGGCPLLGTWQSVFFCEFDGPRRRRFQVQVVSATKDSVRNLGARGVSKET